MEYKAGYNNEGESSVGLIVLVESCLTLKGEGVLIKVEEFIECHQWVEVEDEGIVWYLVA